jgi:peptide/nickel transport system substrate-binding protein
MRRSILFLVLPFSLLSGCGDAGEGVYGSFCEPALARVDSFMAAFDASASPGQEYGGTAVVGAAAGLRAGMNGFDASDVGSAQHQMFVNLMTLIQYDEDLEPVPYLARSWEVSDDLTTVTFHLRDDVLWHDGEPTTAHDVAFTFLRIADPATNYANASFFENYIPGEEGLELVDTYTIRLRLRRPHMDFLDPWRTVAIMPRHLLEHVPPSDLLQHPFGTNCPVGNGPFRFISHDPGARWVFEANPAFPEGLGGRPFLDRYVFRVIEEAPTLLAELETGSVDVYLGVAPHYAPRIEEDPDVDLVSFPYRAVLFAGWNSRNPKLGDPRVRKALTVGTDRVRILEGVRRGLGTVVNTGVPTTHWAYDSTLGDSFPFDPDRARALLAEAGWEDRDGDGVREDTLGTPLSLELLYNPNQEREEVAEIMQAQLRDVGVDLQPRSLEYSAFLNSVFSPERAFEGFVIAWEAEFRLDERDLFHSRAVDAPYGFSGIQDSVLDRYLDTLQLITDRAEAVPLWRAYQLRLMELHPFTFLYSYHRLSGVSRRLRGVVMDVRGEWQNLREWWIAPEDRR